MKEVDTDVRIQQPEDETLNISYLNIQNNLYLTKQSKETRVLM